jgi:hypothetical protein
MAVGFFQPSRRFGAFDNAQVGSIATAGQTWLIGALLGYSSGLLVELTGNTANGVTANTVLGIASSPFTAAITASGGSAIGQETIPAVGAGSAITGPRRFYYPATEIQTFIGSLDTSGGLGNTALSVTDIGNTFAMNSINPVTGALVASGGTWILNRTGTTKTAMVLALVDPPGAKSTDVPNIAQGNTGQSLVEFIVLPGGRLL